MTGPSLTQEARRYVSRMARAILPHAGSLDRRFRFLLRARGYSAQAARAFLAITPTAAARLRPLSRFVEQVQYSGRRLAKLNVQPAEIDDLLVEFSGLLDGVLDGRFQPAREQIALVSSMVLKDAYYQGREDEAQALFCLEHAETQATSLEDLLRRFVAILTRSFRARSGRL